MLKWTLQTDRRASTKKLERVFFFTFYSIFVFEFMIRFGLGFYRVSYFTFAADLWGKGALMTCLRGHSLAAGGGFVDGYRGSHEPSWLQHGR